MPSNQDLKSKPQNLAVLASGNGTNLQAVLDACQRRELPARVVAVFSDQPAAYALQRAREAGVPAEIFAWAPYKQAGKTRREYDADLARRLITYQPEWIVLAGWMRLLSSAFLDSFPGRVINLHPALPGAFPGTHAIQRAWQAYRDRLITETGVMVHLVPDEGIDDGPLLAQEIVPIFPEDTLETLEARIHQVEHRLLLSALQSLIC